MSCHEKESSVEICLSLAIDDERGRASKARVLRGDTT